MITVFIVATLFLFVTGCASTLLYEPERRIVAVGVTLMVALSFVLVAAAQSYPRAGQDPGSYWWLVWAAAELVGFWLILLRAWRYADKRTATAYRRD